MDAATEPDNEPGNAPLSPEQMLALVKDQQIAVEGRIASFVPWILVGWGIAWLAGFLVLWADALGNETALAPSIPAAIVFAALLIGAGALSTVLGIRAGRGLRGSADDAFIGAVYGNMWWVGSIAIVFIGQALVKAGMETTLLGVFYPAMFIVYSGVMYVMSGLIWKARPMVILGFWSVFIGAIGSMIDPPSHYLLFAIAGGGAFLLAAGWTAWWVRRARRRVATVGS